MDTLSVVLGIVHLHALIEAAIKYDLPKPIFSVSPPYRVILNGETVTLTCRCQCPLTRNWYYRENRFIREVSALKGQCYTKYGFTADHDHQGNYTCDCLQLKNRQWRSSVQSDMFHFMVQGELSKPTIYMDPDSGAVSNGENILISCKGDIRSGGGTFLLYNDPKQNPVQTHTVSGTKHNVTFYINTQSEASEGNYSCRYQTMIAGSRVTSPFSKNVTITETDAGNRSFLNIGLGCAAGFIVLLVVALTCFLIAKRTQIRRQHIERIADPAGGASNDKDTDNIYDTVNHPSLPDQNGAYGQVPECDREELTYATLNMEALNQKDAASVTAVDSILYAEVKRK